jgi:hypothetical protein
MFFGWQALVTIGVLYYSYHRLHGPAWRLISGKTVVVMVVVLAAVLAAVMTVVAGR